MLVNLPRLQVPLKLGHRPRPEGVRFPRKSSVVAMEAMGRSPFDRGRVGCIAARYNICYSAGEALTGRWFLWLEKREIATV